MVTFDTLDGDESEYEETIISGTCNFCRHLNMSEFIKHTCKAFPDGIPPDIWLGKNNHTKPYPGDNGVRFEKVTQ